MKRLLSALFILCSFSQIYAQKGVAFLTGGNLRTVFDVAKTQNKYVFLEAYAPTCHVCNAFKPTFENAQVGNFYNQNFVSYKLDMTSAEATAFLQKQKIYIPSTPTLLFFDKNVKLIHIAVMGEQFNTPQVLVDAASKALSPQNRSTAYKASFLAGNRDNNFLIEYANFARITKDTAQNIAAMDAYFRQIPKKQLASNTSFLVLQKLVMSDENGLFKYLITHLTEFYGKFDKKDVNQAAENILMYSLYSSAGNRYSIAKVNEVKANLAKAGVNAQAIQGRVWMAEARAYFKAKQADKGIQVIESLLKTTKSTPSAKEYAFLCEFVKGLTSDKNALSKASAWCKSGGK